MACGIAPPYPFLPPPLFASRPLSNPTQSDIFSGIFRWIHLSLPSPPLFHGLICRLESLQGNGRIELSANRAGRLAHVVVRRADSLQPCVLFRFGVERLCGAEGDGVDFLPQWARCCFTPAPTRWRRGKCCTATCRRRRPRSRPSAGWRIPGGWIWSSACRCATRRR